MSNTPLFLYNSAPRSERRRHTRQQLRTLAYLDIGTDNGGIVLNFSEDGMALQAVAPIEDQTQVSLRIQVPNSRTRIEIEAQVVWLNESKCHVGVHFLEMSSPVRTQVEDWLCSLGLPITPSDGTSGPRETAPESRNKKDLGQEPRNDKWLSLMAEFEERATEDNAPPTVAEPPPQKSAAQLGPGLTTTSSSPQSTLGRTGSVASPDEALESGVLTQRHSPYSLRPVAAKVNPASQPSPAYTSHPVTDVPERERAPETTPPSAPVPASASAVPAAPAPSAPTTPPVVKPPKPATSSENYLASAMRALPSATRRSSARKWAGLAGMAALLVLLSISFFGIGRWFGSLDTGLQPIPPPQTPVIVPSAGNPGVTGSDHKDSGERAPKAARAGREGRAITSSAPRNSTRRPSPPINAPAVQATPPEAQAAPTNLSVARVAPPETTSAPAPFASTAASATAPATIVGGRALKPTDRFNPCHLTYRVEPEYPAEALKQRIEGAVKIHLIIGADGTVRDMKLLSGSSTLAPAAMDASKYWQFLPALLNGQPVETEQDIEIDFRLPH